MTEQMTIGMIAQLWKADKRKYVKYSTFSAYALILENHILPAFGQRTRIEEQDVQEFVLQKLRQGLRQKTIKDMLVVLKMVVKFGAALNSVSLEKWDIRFPTDLSCRRIPVLNLENHRKILEYLRSHQSLRDLGIYISLATGMRIGEICGLKWEDIDLSEGVIRVRRTIERIYSVENGVRRTELIIGPPKTLHSIRDIPINTELMAFLLPLKVKASHSHYLLTGTDRPTEPRTYRNHYNRLLKRLDIPHIKFHGLRHSFATRCIESNCDYKTVSVILGHSDIRTTLNLYVHPNLEQKRRCIDRMFDMVYVPADC